MNDNRRMKTASVLSRKKLISIIVPAYNEENNVERTVQRIAEQLSQLESHHAFELIFIDDHSTDRTFPRLKALAQTEDRLSIIRFQRNYGMQRAVHTGYSVARGDAAIVLECDLQDPPELIHDFIHYWEKGYRVVYGVRRTRKEGRIITATRRFFYWLINKLSDDDLPRDAGECRLIDRDVIEELKKIHDTNIYVRGRIASMGFSHIGVPYDRLAREFDESKFTFFKNVGVALDGIVSHSIIPLRISTLLGMLLVVAAFLGIIFYTVMKVFFGADWQAGFATLVVILLFSTGLNGLFLGIMGEYLARIYAQLKMRSEPIIETRIEGRTKAGTSTVNT